MDHVTKNRREALVKLEHVMRQFWWKNLKDDEMVQDTTDREEEEDDKKHVV